MSFNMPPVELPPSESSMLESSNNLSETHRKVSCPRCGKDYRVSLALISKEQMQFGCRNCPEVFTPQGTPATMQPLFDEENPAFDVDSDSSNSPEADQSSSKILRIMARTIAALFLLAATGGLGTMWWLTEQGRTPEWLLGLKQQHNLMLEERIEGRVIINQPSARPLIVVSGTLENRFRGDAPLRWVRLIGSARESNANQDVLALTYTYAGHFLSDTQLATMSWSEIRAFHNQRPKSNRAEKNIRYQLIFLPPTDKEPRHVQVKVQSYQIKDRPVFIEEGQM